MTFFTLSQTIQATAFFMSMFRERQYQIETKPWMLDTNILKQKYKSSFIQTINATKKKKINLQFFIKAKTNQNKNILVIFLKKLIKYSAEEITKTFGVHKYDTVIFFCEDAIKSSLHFLMQQHFMNSYELFSLSDILFTPIHHKIQTKLELCDYHEIEQYLGDRDLTKYELSKINQNDPVLKWYGYKKGSFIKYKKITQDGLFVEYKQIS